MLYDGERIEAVRRMYKPRPINVLLLAEAPPTDPERFFYYEHVPKQDGLFLELMKVLYKTANYKPKAVRKNKALLLSRFKHDGFYLIDASSKPIPQGASTRQKTALLEQQIDKVVGKVNELVKEGSITLRTPIVLVAVPVFNACCESLKDAGFNIVNKEAIPSASSGQQACFRAGMSAVLEQLHVTPIDVLGHGWSLSDMVPSTE
jgi:hypothetical protein